jgi:hypothetical protein
MGCSVAMIPARPERPARSLTPRRHRPVRSGRRQMNKRRPPGDICRTNRSTALSDDRLDLLDTFRGRLIFGGPRATVRGHHRAWEDSMRHVDPPEIAQVLQSLTNSPRARRRSARRTGASPLTLELSVSSPGLASWESSEAKRRLWSLCAVSRPQFV